MRYLSPGLLILMTMLLAGPAGAYVWDQYLVGDGLPDDHVRGLHEAADGSIWAATLGGLGRWDGSIWSTVSTEAYTRVAGDGQGRVWAGGPDGNLDVFTASGSVVDMGPLFDGEIQTDVLGLAARGTEEMYVLTRSSLWLWQKALPLSRFVVVAPNVNFVCVASGPAGQAWIGDSTGLLRKDPDQTGAPVREVDLGSTQTVGTVAVLTDGTVIFTTNLTERIVAYQPLLAGQVTDLSLPDGFAAQTILGQAQDNEANLWCTGQDAFQFDTEAGDPAMWPAVAVTDADGLFSDRIEAVLPVTSQDEQQVWFGSQDGLFVRRTVNWQVYDTDNGLLGAYGGNCEGVFAPGDCNNVDELTFDLATGTLWAGGVKGLSRRTSDGAWTGWTTLLPYGIFTPLLHPQVQSLMVDANGVLWVGTGSDPFGAPNTGGLEIHRPGWPDDQWESIGASVSAPRYFTYDLAQEPQGPVWTASHDGAWRYVVTGNDTTVTGYSAAEGAVDGPVYAVATSADGVAVGAKEGFFAYRNTGTGAWTRYALEDVLGASGATTGITDLLITGQQIYVATREGLVALSEGATDLTAARLLGPAQGFADDLLSISVDDDGFLMVATSTGLYRLDTDFSRWRRFGEQDGLVSAQTTSAISPAGELWVGTQANGLMNQRLVPAATVLVKAPQEVVSSRETLELVVDATDSDGPSDQVAFQWRVDLGNWSPVPATLDRTITFVPSFLSLGEGGHLLEVRAEDADFNLEKTPLQLGFELDESPPVPIVTEPLAAEAVQGALIVIGTADDLRFARYRVRVWPTTAGESQAVLLAEQFEPVVDGPLAPWNTMDQPDDRYTIEVSVTDTLGITGTSQVNVLVDNLFPFAEQTSPVHVLRQDGATVYSADGRAQLRIPPYALAADQQVELDQVAVAGSHDGNAYRIVTADAEFAKTVTLVLNLPDEPQEGLTIHRLEGTVWQPLGGGVSDGEALMAVTGPGTFALAPGGVASSSGDLVKSFDVEPRHFRPRSGVGGDAVNITFTLTQDAQVDARIYSRNGRPRRVLVKGETLGPGAQALVWDGTDTDGHLLEAGLYIVAVQVGDDRLTKVIQIGRN